MFRRISVAALSAALVAGHHAGLRLHRHQPEGRGRRRHPCPHPRIRLPAPVQRGRGSGREGIQLRPARRRQVVGANAFDAVALLDGLNDQGLSIGLFNFPGYAKYAEATKENAAHSLAPQDFGMWVLGNFGTVDEVKRAVKDIVMVPTPFPGLGSPEGAVAPVHFFIQDKTGQSIAVEPVDGTLKVTDAPLGVMTNAPTYDWHMTNLDNYINL
jgi:penicillin V acylase-like amidase (Ntn superfamily)